MLFVDLLGVRAMNRGPQRAVRSNLIALERAVSGMYRDYLEPDSPWPGALFSDTLVLAAPVPDQDGGAEVALGGLVLQACWLQLNLIDQGFFMRGALALGDFYIRDGVIFGPALVDAAELEHDVAVHPRIILSREAEKSQRRALRDYADPQQAPQDGALTCDGDGWTFINYLSVLLDETDDPRAGLRMHRDRIVARLAETRARKRVWEKYRWAAEYHNEFVGRTFAAEVDLLVPIDAMTWEFTRFV
ncbi:MAG TPA: hypothetical protein VFG42_17035 [Baekduia sp.]|uniref:hypothetical protein n=1 Tax=Baekduia sp. TaxID=2600305 RepID=UPI002D78735F|nr:hypothetical protein [Baekduia sp.]HET6508500.1 hypothetical protein [Baekduia sp.]